MDWLNYHHLLYFWVTAKRGSINEASKALRLSQSTISEQIKTLEKSINNKLFEKQGRNLVLTDAGRVALEYANQIFQLGNELNTVLLEKSYSKLQHFMIGVTSSIPKLISYRLIQPILELENKISFTILENTIDELGAMLALNKIDIIISEQTIRTSAGTKLFNHNLGNSPISLYAHVLDKRDYLKNFPESLDNAPMLLPREGTSFRNQLDLWFYKNKIKPQLIGEFEDSALLKEFANDEKGLFFSPAVISQDICKKFNVKEIVKIADIKEDYFAITSEKKIKNIASEAILEHAREKLFN